MSTCSELILYRAVTLSSLHVPLSLLLPLSCRDRRDFTNYLGFLPDRIIDGLSTLPAPQKSVPHGWCPGWLLNVPSLPCSVVATVVSTVQQPSGWSFSTSHQFLKCSMSIFTEQAQSQELNHQLDPVTTPSRWPQSLFIPQGSKTICPIL